MEIKIETTSKDGSLTLYVINSDERKILTLIDNDKGSCTLAPGFTYRFEWHVWSQYNKAAYSIKAEVNPQNANFPPFNWSKTYPNPHQDVGSFPFSS
ncbi:MAG: hypothetical protein WCP85_06785 [Mariniphaga sp.]